MSDANFNITDNKANSGNIYTPIVTTDVVGTNTNVTTATYVDLGPTASFTTSTTNEVVTISWSGECRLTAGTTGAASIYIAVNIDGTDYPLIPNIKFSGISSDEPLAFSYSYVVPTIGAHTVKLRGRLFVAGHTVLVRDSLGLALTNATGTFQVTQHLNSGGGAGDAIILTEDTLGSDFTIDTTQGVLDTGLSVAIETLEDENVVFNVNGAVQWVSPAASLVNTILYYQVDSDPEVAIHIDQVGDPGSAAFNVTDSANTSFVIPNLSAGVHTVKLRMEVTGSGTRSGKLVSGAKIQTVQYRAAASALLKEVLTWTPSAQSTTSASLIDITGVTNLSIDVPRDGEYVFDLDVNGYYHSTATGLADWVFAVNVDDGGTVTEFPQISANNNTLTDRNSSSTKVKITLTKGQRDIRIQWKKANVSSTVLNLDTNCRLTLSII